MNRWILAVFLGYVSVGCSKSPAPVVSQRSEAVLHVGDAIATARADRTSVTSVLSDTQGHQLIGELAWQPLSGEVHWRTPAGVDEAWKVSPEAKITGAQLQEANRLAYAHWKEDAVASSSQLRESGCDCCEYHCDDNDCYCDLLICGCWPSTNCCGDGRCCTPRND